MDSNINQIFQDWEKISKTNINNKLPTYFIDLDSNCDLNSLMDEITNQLEKNKLVIFSGDYKKYYYSFNLIESPYYIAFNNFHFIYKEKLSKFNIPFKGVLFIDISSHYKSYQREEFVAFLSYLKSINDDVVIFFISKNSNELNQKMFETVAKHFWIERINHKIENKKNVINDDLDKICKNKNLDISKDTKKEIINLIENKLKSNSCNVFETLNNFINKLIYEKIKKGSKTLNLLTHEDLNIPKTVKTIKQDESIRMF